MSVTEIQLYKLLKAKLGDETAQELVNFIKSEINAEFMECKKIFLVKDDKAEIIRYIFIAGAVQYLAIIGSLLAILSFLKYSG